jgi:hypothetical protein
MSHWTGLPKRGATRISPRDVRIERDGKRWTASWHVEDDRLLVWSAWGSRTEPVGPTTDLGSRARALLTEILDGRS